MMLSWVAVRVMVGMGGGVYLSVGGGVVIGG